MNLAYFPIVNTEDELIDLVSRAAWFLSFCPIERIYVPIASQHLQQVQWRVAPGMDHSIANNFDTLRGKVVFVVARAAGDLEPCMNDSAMILHWRKDAQPAFITKEQLAEWEKGKKKILQVDPMAIRQEGGFYIDVGFALMEDRAGTIQKNKCKFEELAKRLGRFQRAILMATGPSVTNYKYLDFEGSLSIICNSVILDKDLMETVRPQILVFADPIFHFGPSQYAGAFRQMLAESARQNDFTICIPLKYYPLFTAAMPELTDRTIGIPFVKDRPWNFDLTKDFTLKTTANILTFLMVPLAATFSEEIGFLGCNGRPLNENTYFWSHCPATQINDKMANIRVVHPGFFNIDYNDYYLDHCETLEQQLLEGERQGIRFVSLGFSHIPALNTRLGRGRRMVGPRLNSSKLDAILVTLAGSASAPTEMSDLHGLEAALSLRSVAVHRLHCSIEDIPSLERAVRQILANTTDGRSESLIYAHEVPLRVAKHLAPLASSYSNLRLHFRLDGLLNESGADQLSDEATFLSWLANSEPRVFATVKNYEEMTKLAEMTGSIFHVATPFPPAKDDKLQAMEWQRYAEYLLDTRSTAREYPRLLVIDLTNMGGFAATSRIKETFFGTWPDEKYRIVYVEGGAKKHLAFADKQGKIIETENGNSEISRAVAEFAPELLYYRAVDQRLVHELAAHLADSLPVPLVVHMMDDWPARLRKNKPDQFAFFDQTLRLMLRDAAACLSIGEKMSDAFKERYGVDFRPFSNAVDPASFPPRERKHVPGEPFIIRYTGALAKDMTFDSICEIADAIEDLAPKLNTCLEIFTRSPWKEQSLKKFAGMSSVSVMDQVPSEDYNSLLQHADALLIAYNFDEESQTYVGYSMANKLPEYLASGVPVLIYGPPNAATVEYARERGCIQLIDQHNPQAIREAIRGLVTSPELQARLGKDSMETALVRHNLWRVASDFHRLLIDVAKPPERTLLGPYDRAERMHWDETNGVAHLFAHTLTGQIMIDVGAHHGTALQPFLNMGWRVFAFEPDEKNRAKLLERLAKHQNASRVRIDTHAVGSQSRNGLPFYRSEESTGVSGLSAFLSSHRLEQTVDMVSLTDALADETISAIDFLKIDTEGHDLFVLQGFPWHRFQPAVIECEFEDLKTVPLGYTFHDLAKFLSEKGYAVYVSEWHPIVRYGIRHDWNRLMRYPCELADTQGWGNLLAFRDPIDERELIAAVKRVMKVGTDSTAKLPGPEAKAPGIEPSNKPALRASTKAGAPGTGFRFETSPCFRQVDPVLWRYTHSEAHPKLWIAIADPVGQTVGRTFVGEVRLKADRAVTVMVSLGRHGKTAYEGTSKRILLAPSETRNVRLSKEFTKAHDTLKLQVEVMGLENGDSAMLTLDALYINETLTSIRRRVGEASLNVREANRLFREGKLLTAMAIYLLLHQQRPLRIYPDNALLAARKLGMTEVKTVEELLQRFGE